ncbi:MAG: hypothetical protein QXG03_12025 [Halalkalicoccus sp.]
MKLVGPNSYYFSTYSSRITPEPVEWHVDAAGSRSVRALVYVAVGLLGGGVLLVFAAMAFVGVSAAFGGEYAFLAYGLLLALIGGPLSVLYLLPVLTDRDQRPPLAALFADEEIADRYAATFTRTRLLAAVLGGALGLLALFSVAPRAAFAVVAGSLLLVPVASGMISRGRIDPEAGTMTYIERSIPLSGVERVRRLDPGGTSLCWLSYYPGYGSFGTPHLIVATPEAADTIERTVAAVKSDVDEEYEPDRAVQLALGALALSSLSTAVFVFFAEPGSAGDPLLRWYIVGGFGFFGGIFALAAVFAG